MTTLAVRESTASKLPDVQQLTFVSLNASLFRSKNFFRRKNRVTFGYGYFCVDSKVTEILLFGMCFFFSKEGR